MMVSHLYLGFACSHFLVQRLPNFVKLLSLFRLDLDAIFT